jgi:hypothetical protein
MKEMITARRLLDAVINKSPNARVRDRLEEIWFSDNCVEPGYDKETLRAFGDWNEIDSRPDPIRDAFLRMEGKEPEKVDLTQTDEKNVLGKLAAALEKMGFELEWEDEWAACDGCGATFRISGNGYDWTPYYIATDDGKYCGDCLADSFEDYIEIYAEENKAVPSHIKLEDYGYAQYNGQFESGFHYGQDASPKVIRQSMAKLGVDHVLFQLDFNSQFTTGFSTWVRKEDHDKVKSTPIEVNGPSNAAMLSQMLQNAVPISIELPAPAGES